MTDFFFPGTASGECRSLPAGRLPRLVTALRLHLRVVQNAIAGAQLFAADDRQESVEAIFEELGLTEISKMDFFSTTRAVR